MFTTVLRKWICCVFVAVFYSLGGATSLNTTIKLHRVGEVLNLNCSASSYSSPRQPEWLVPQLVSKTNRYHRSKPKFEIEEGHPVWANSITVTNLQPDDTGLYVCIAKDVATENTASYEFAYSIFYVHNWKNAYAAEVNERRLQAYYVYVSDGPSQPPWFVTTKPSTTVERNGELIIPCIATHPKITLDIERIPNSYPIDYQRLQYDSALGYIVPNAKDADNGFWKCIAKRKHQGSVKILKTSRIIVSVIAPPAKELKAKIYTTFGGKVLINESFQVICEVPVNRGDRVKFNWTLEQDGVVTELQDIETEYLPISEADGKRHGIQPFDSKKSLAKSICKVSGASHQGLGLYKCAITSASVTKAVATNIQTFDSPYIKITRQPKYNEVHRNKNKSNVHVIKAASNLGISVDLTIEVDTLSYPTFQWSKLVNGNWTDLLDSKFAYRDAQLAVSQYQYYVQGNLFEIFNVLPNMEGLYKLHVSTPHTSKDVFIKLEVYDPRVPTVAITGPSESVILGEHLNLFCNTSGMPFPVVRWYYNGTIIANTTSLEILRVTSSEAGNYSCVAENIVGTAIKSIWVQIYDSEKDHRHQLTVSLILIGILLVICSVVLVIKIRKVRKIQKRMDLSQRYLVPILNKTVESNVSDQLDKQSYDAKKWEFPRDRLKLGKTVGRGAFGKVIQATAFDIDKSSTCRTVAVKMLKVGSRSSEFRALMSELKILIHLGSNLNIVNLLGACTTKDGPLMIIVEYCKHGNLSSYLRRMRPHFIRHRNKSKNGEESDIDETKIHDVEEHFDNDDDAFIEPNEEIGDELWTGYDSKKSLYRYSIKRKRKSRHSSNESDGEIKYDHDDEEIHNKNEKSSITTADLLSYSLQVARGMEFLASKDCIHRDLAARNILLAENQVVKICDFGLARDVYKDPDYVQNGEARLPLKWMAPEAIFDKKYTSKSDVWSFGVLLWEIFSMGRSPYPGITMDEDFCNKLKRGVRMRTPKYAINEIYSVMIACWVNDPEERPEFMNLAEEISDILQTEAEHEYLDIMKLFDTEKKDRGVKPQPHPDETFEEKVVSERTYADYVVNDIKDLSGSSNTFSSTSDYKTMESDSCRSSPINTSAIKTKADVCRIKINDDEEEDDDDTFLCGSDKYTDVPPSYSAAITNLK